MRTGTPYVESAAPQVKVAFFNIAGTAVGVEYANYAAGGTSQRRLVYIHKKEEPYTGNATIRLLNQDGVLNTVDFLGCICAITWGWATGTGSVDEPVWVTSQKFVSQEGLSLCELTLVNAWEMLEQSRRINILNDTDMTNPSTGSDRVWPADTTVLNIITEIIQTVGGFLEQWSLDTVTTITAEPAGAGAIQTYSPIFGARLNDSDSMLLRRLLQMSNSVITFRASTGTTINWIDTSLPGPYYTYKNDGIEHPFFWNLEGSALPVPNRIIFVDQEPDPSKDQVANFVGQAEMATFPLGELAVVIADGSIASDAEAQLRAEKYLDRLIHEGDEGQIEVPMNCCQELYDELEIIDTRTGITHYARAGIIERIFEASANHANIPDEQRDLYICRITLGGIGGGSTRIKSPAGGINDIDTTVSDLKTRSSVNPFVDTPQINGGILSQHLAPIERRIIPTPPGPYAVPALNALIPGATTTFNVVVPSVLDAVGIFHFTQLVGALAGDYATGVLMIDGVAQAAVAISVASVAGALIIGPTVSQTWARPLAAGSHTIALAFASNNPLAFALGAIHTSCLMWVISDKNATVS